MKRYKTVLFDLDGTLLDTSPGIIYCYNETAKHFGLAERSADKFRGVIGGALPANFVKYFGFTEETSRNAVDFYRNEYALSGIKMATAYPHMSELLSMLAVQGISTAVATLKREDFAIDMLHRFGLSDKLNLIKGMDERDTRTKASIIDMCLSELGTKKSDAVLIGDSENDAQGAKKSGIDFIGVYYGWGFDTRVDIERGYHVGAAETVIELQQLLMQKG